MPNAAAADDSEEEELGGAASGEEEDALPASAAPPSSKRSKKNDAIAQRKAQEEETVRLENRLATGAGEGDPQTHGECERLVTASPHTADAWVRYMAWCCRRGDVEGARAIAARGLAAIRVREEAERLALWTAWMNLEAGEGGASSPQLKAVFKRALEGGGCDPKALHFAYLGILERALAGLRGGKGGGDAAAALSKELEAHLSGMA